MSDILISERTPRAWIPTCPVQVKKLRLVKRDDGLFLSVTTVPCGDFSVRAVTLDLLFFSERRDEVGRLENREVPVGESEPVPVPFEKASRPAAVVRAVKLASGEVWENPDGGEGVEFPEQAVYWQTDPLTETVRRECEGVVEPRFVPDKIDGAWRCACGQINLDGAKKCGACGCPKSWLDEHLDRDYLEKRRAAYAEEAKKQPEKVRRRKTVSSDKTKAVALLSAAAALIVLVVLTFTLFIPSIRYAHAASLLASGEYDRAAAIFARLGGFRDARDRQTDAVYQKARAPTGLDTVNITTSAQSPWYSISDDGVLSFRKDPYEKAGGAWTNFVVPDMVDGIIVRELDRNFLLNCKDVQVVTLSDCTEVIGEQAFYNCESLFAVAFGKNLKEIGPRAFINCPALEEITVPDTVEKLGNRAFNKCVNLRRAVLGKGITVVEDFTFSYCLRLKSVTFSSPPASIGADVFAECPAFDTIFCRFDESEWHPVLSDAGETDPLGGAKLSFGN